MISHSSIGLLPRLELRLLGGFCGLRGPGLGGRLGLAGRRHRHTEALLRQGQGLTGRLDLRLEKSVAVQGTKRAARVTCVQPLCKVMLPTEALYSFSFTPCCRGWFFLGVLCFGGFVDCWRSSS